ncbi:MAG: ComEC/Rec2 family competence protein [Actinomycetota bacterium]
MSLTLVALSLWGTLAILIANSIDGFWLLLLGVLFGVSGILLPANRRALVVLLAAGYILSGVSLWMQEMSNNPAWISKSISSGQESRMRIELLNQPKRLSSGFGESYGVAVSIVEIEKQPASGRGYLIYKMAGLARGQQVEFLGKFYEPGFSARDAFLLKPKSEITVVAEPTIEQGFVNNLRANYLSQIQGVTNDAAGLVAGLAIGDVSGVSEGLQKQMRDVSLTHLVAVSGSNCAIVIGLVYLIAVRFRFGLSARTFISLAALVGYIAVVGPDASVLRAGVMTGAVMLMIATGRRAYSLHALAIAVLVLLIADPWLSLEFGFGLSVLATAGILLLAPALSERLQTRMPKLLALALAVTVSAQLLCLPLLLQLQPGLPSYSILANLLAGPAVAPITVVGMIALVLTPVFPSLVGPVSYLASLGAFWIELCARTIAEFPMVYYPWLDGALGILAALTLILVVSIWLRSKNSASKAVGSMGLVVFAVATFTAPAAAEIAPGRWPNPDWDVVACDVGQGDAFVIRSMGRVAVIDVGPEPVAIDKCLSELNIRTIDLLVLTHFDFDHVGGLTGAIDGRRVEVAIISGFPDDRPATKNSLELLSGSKVLVANEKLVGKLGDVSWRVIAPTAEASEASDSNDASVVTMFRFPGFDMLLLGDLGAKGQERIRGEIRSILAQSHYPLILKVSHHGSNDQSESFHQALGADVALISVGEANGYGHPGASALKLLSDSLILRTDESGSIAIAERGGFISWQGSGG